LLRQGALTFKVLYLTKKTTATMSANCVYRFKVSGFGASIQVGVSKISAAGPVKNLTRLEDFSGNYRARPP